MFGRHLLRTRTRATGSGSINVSWRTNGITRIVTLSCQPANFSFVVTCIYRSGRFSDKSPEQEKAEKRRQIPYHQHINLDLLEACHLISAMFLETPNIAAAGVDESRRTRVISRTFRKYHDIYDRQVFTGPPEQTRDFVMTATKALMKGDWKKCSDLLNSLEVWDLVAG